MIATAYELDIRRWIRLGFPRQPWEIDLVCLCDKFVDSKLHISLTEEERVDITNDGILDNHERLKEIILEDFERCALVATLPSPILELLHDKKIQEQVQTFLVKVQAGNVKTGIVMNVVEGKPQFMHRTFAEYFAARWFSKNFESNRSFLEQIFFDRRYRVLRDMFDRMLAKGCPLHCAVLNRDSGSVETLLQEGWDVSAVDSGGRTVMHIIATRSKEFPDITDLLLNYEASLDRSDCVLQWTPLQYAIKSEDWAFVELLLESKVDRADLNMIRQRADDPDYIGPVIIDAVRNGHLLLLEFLCSIGVNIHRISSRRFPSSLHVAIQFQQLPVVKWLIQHGADCNTGYCNGQTLLFHAVTRSSLDVVRALVEEGGASLDVRDDYGRTAIDWAKYCISVRKNFDSTVWKSDVEQLNEIVKYLQERGCKESSSVWQNNYW
jgi:ankyrin repeat protein